MQKKTVLEAPETPEAETKESSLKMWHILSALGLVGVYYYYTKQDDEKKLNDKLDMGDTMSDTDSVVSTEVSLAPPSDSPVQDKPPVVTPKRVSFLDKD